MDCKMARYSKIHLLVLFLACHVFAAESVVKIADGSASENASANIQKFDEKFSLRFLCDYTLWSVWNTEYGNEPLVSNSPLSLGLGFAYDDLFTLFGVSWDIAWDFKMSLLLTSGEEKSKIDALETGLDLFPGKFWIEAWLSYYAGFSVKTEKDGKVVHQWTNLNFFEMYISVLWMLTPKEKFSPRSAYFLDRRQNHSAGSWIFGGRFQGDVVEDPDSLLTFYEGERSLGSIWANVGYTYTWVFENGFFGNVWLDVGLIYGLSEEDKYAVFPEPNFKTAWGYIGEKWSWNVVVEAEYNAFSYKSYWEQKLIVKGGILVVRRF